MSPELFDTEIKDHHRTKYSDCYALGMVIYEVLSLRIPFHKDSDLTVVLKVSRGNRPERPEEAGGVVRFTDDMWGLLKLCWAEQPENRPNIEDILQYLEKCSRSWTSPPLLSVMVPPAVDLSTWNTSESTVSTPHLRRVEQVTYQPLNTQRDWARLPPIYFLVKSREGIKLADALERRFDGLDGRDDPVFADPSIGSSFVCRIDVCDPGDSNFHCYSTLHLISSRGSRGSPGQDRYD